MDYSESLFDVGSSAHYGDAENQSINVNGTVFAYRDVGPRTGVPLVLLNHWGATGAAGLGAPASPGVDCQW